MTVTRGGDEVFELAVAVVEHRVDAVDQGVLAAHEGVIGAVTVVALSCPAAMVTL
ncbi:hypothetical protein GYM47_11815 [Vreelandella piezotolerans]|uniref:hypothetical protein n=1 Tax=Vreelandella piezotolerans TaxID=2609667 RepID=UPI0014449DB9|nr:hypothetical protein [Halomonas piezotolerans]QJA24735.1 hypothetical protein GYM47_11815 [Halomonas piezotolerans]